ncbi:MAG: hypothetical protein CSA97_01975 [Bacteroidetes bacterium]|nr:MAG: hypothetical protein CSA97_01975 [Bacteroidota bacterium]
MGEGFMDTNWVVMDEYASYEEAVLVQGRLENEGVVSEVYDLRSSAYPIPIKASARLLVPLEEVGRATVLLEKWSRRAEGGDLCKHGL